MNIQEAKKEIYYTLQAYLRKDADGNYCFPTVRQRPILLMGPPGIGKTAIVEQAAQEQGIGLVCYTMTHHTRQSAVGLPKIVAREYDGVEVSVTEYTLSEMIASVYECMERTGSREGILFLDEINCVSETLSPTMLQFLQNKKFGSHKVPEGWVIVAAGNPPQYNKSVREFDIVTLDRVRRLDVEPDLDVWMTYAWEKEVHGAILSYLTLKKERFYQIRRNGEEKAFVTARGWEDLSELLKNYEAIQAPCGLEVMRQYLQEEETAREFAAYYQLYEKYQADYGIAEILDGSIEPGSAWYEEKVQMAGAAGFEERCMVINLLLDAVGQELARFERIDEQAVLLQTALKQYLKQQEKQGKWQGLTAFAEKKREQLQVKEQMGLESWSSLQKEQSVLRMLESYDLTLQMEHIREKEAGMNRIRSLFQEGILRQRMELLKRCKVQMSRMFAFAHQSFSDAQEMILLVSGLTKNAGAMRFICAHGCEEYMKYCDVLMPEDREKLLWECSQIDV